MRRRLKRDACGATPGAHLDNLDRLILVRRSRKQPPAMRRRRHDQLGENAARAPHVNRRVVLLLAQQNLGRSVPAGDHVLREQRVLRLASSRAEIANAHVAVLAHKSAARAVSAEIKQSNQSAACQRKARLPTYWTASSRDE